MDKVSKSSKNITPFGGLNFIYNALNRSKINTFIDEKLGYRNFRAHYSYSDIVLSLLGNSLCNGQYISDLEHLKNKFSRQYFENIPSPDTVEYACQELKTATIQETTEGGIFHQFNYDNDKNKALVALCVKTGQLKKTEKYTLDFDNVVLENQKQDAKRSYKNTNGYHPNFSFIGRLPVHIENHNGNTPAKYKQLETLERCFKNLKDNNIIIQNYRGDSASYQKEIIEFLGENAQYFFIRNISSQNFINRCGKIKDWKTIHINNEKKQVATMIYTPFKGEFSYRVVVTRTLKKDQQIDLISETAYNYYGIMTNNLSLSNQEVIEFYNQRGDAENSNKFLISDFNLKHLPFMDFDTNTVYIYLMAMCNILFEWTKIILVKNKTANINLKMRVKAVCFRYITVATTFVNHSREKILKVFSDQEYKILEI
jgi:Transposase DDE domain group 1